MNRISMIAVIAMAFVLGACGNPRLSASGDTSDAGQNNNVNNNDNQTDPDPYAVTCTLKSSEEIAVWLETADGHWEFGPAYTVEECPEGPTYRLDFNPTGVFLVSASNDLDIVCNEAVDLHWIDGDPEAFPYSFWDFEQTLNNLWLLPGYWEFEFFPETEGQAEGFELGTSAFICALGLDMLNLGCDGEIEEEFFLYDGTVYQAYYEEGEYMPIVRWGLVQDLNKSRRIFSDALPRVTRL